MDKKVIEKYLDSIQNEQSSASVMTFHVDSFPGKKDDKFTNENDYEELIKKRIMIDFDGVIHKYTEWNNGELNDEVIPGSKEAIDILKEVFEIVIFTTRVSLDGIENEEREIQREKVTQWLKDHDIYFDKITSEKLGAIAYIDDNAIRFQGNWNEVFDILIEKVKQIMSSPS